MPVELPSPTRQTSPEKFEPQETNSWVNPPDHPNKDSIGMGNNPANLLGLKTKYQHRADHFPVAETDLHCFRICEIHPHHATSRIAQESD